MDDTRRTNPSDAQWAPMSDEAWAEASAASPGTPPVPDTVSAPDSNATAPGNASTANGAPAYRPSAYAHGAGAQAAEGLPDRTRIAPASLRPLAHVPVSPSDTAPQRMPRAAQVPVESPRPLRESVLGGRDGATLPGNDPHRPAREPRPPKPARHGCAAALLWLIVLATIAFMGLRLIPLDHSTGRMVPELVSFMPLALVPSIFCLVLAALWRRRILFVVCALALGVNGWWHAGYLIPTARVSRAAETAVASSSTTDDAYARIMTVNTLNGSASAQEIVDTCRAQHVEVLCLQELTTTMVNDLLAAGITDVLPHYIVSDEASAISNGGRNGIFTAASMSNVSYNLLPIETSSMPAVDIQIGGTTVRVVSVHPNSPTRGAQDLWNEGLSVIGTLSNYDHAYLVMGDFNSTWDHARFRELLGSTFVDASEQAGEGFHMTYPANSAIPSIIEIDHIVYSKNSGITVSSLQTVEIAGTDHQALLATLEAS